MRLHSRNRKRTLDQFQEGTQSVAPSSQYTNAKKFKGDETFDESHHLLLGQRMKALCDRIPDKDIVQAQLLKKYI
jgi:hypothetical protein